MRVNQWIWLVLLPVVAGCEGDDSESSVVAELQQHTIVFARNDTPLNVSGGTKRSLYSMRGDGSNVTDLSRHPSGGYPSGSPGYDRLPTYSPSASYIAFQSTREGNEEVYRMNPDGSGTIDLTAWQDHDEDFGISPDGLKIAFARLTSGVYQVWTMGSDGTLQRRVTGTTEDARYPYWSPDGSKLVFSQRVTVGSNVYWQVMTANADGSNPQKLTDSTESAVYPRWSKDGMRIYYDVVGSGMAYRDVSGAGRGSLAQVSGLYLSYSPDGTRFMTSGLRLIDRDLKVSSQFNVVGDQPSWSSDGKWIVFRREGVGGVSNLYVVRPDGSDERQITTSQYGDLNPAWMP
jgi:Tol biopolymer transport system component